MEVLDISQVSQSPVSNDKKSLNKQNVTLAQNRFIGQVIAGKSKKEAFLDALSVVTEKYNPKNDMYCCDMMYSNSKPVAMKNISPKDIEAWLNLLTKAITALTVLVDFIMNTADKIENRHKSQNPQQTNNNNNTVQYNV